MQALCLAAFDLLDVRLWDTELLVLIRLKLEQIELICFSQLCLCWVIHVCGLQGLFCHVFLNASILALVVPIPSTSGGIENFLV